jgi:hypothetical protein
MWLTQSCGLETRGVTTLPPKTKSHPEIWKGERFKKGQRTVARSLSTTTRSLDDENGGNLHPPMLLLLPYGCSIGSCRTWSSCALWHGSFGPRSWSDVWDVSSPCLVVPLPAIQHLRVPSNTSLAKIRGKCHELLPMTVVTLTCMPPSHTSPELEMVQYNEVIAFLSLQISSRPSLAKHLSTCGLQPQTVRVGASCLHSSLGATLWLLNFLGYDVPFIRPQQQCPGQI